MDLNNYTTPKVDNKKTSERAEAIRQFEGRVNFENGNPLTGKLLAIKRSHIPTAHLYSFFKECNGSDNFNRMWWGKLKIKK